MKKYHWSDAHRLQTAIRENQQEAVLHGTEGFPCASYVDYYDGRQDSYPWQWHEELEIAYVDRGQVEVLAGDRRFLLGPGDGIFINERVLHSFVRKGEESVSMPNILFRPVLLYGSQESVYWEKYVKPLVLSPALSCVPLKGEAPWQEEALSCAKKAFSLLTEEAFGYEFHVRAALSDLLLLLGQHMPKDGAASVTSRTEMNRMRRMLSFIQMHYREAVTVEQIADSALISRRECMRLFQRVIGTSPMQYLIDCRIRKAKQLLLETDGTILHIAASCGFQNQSYFTKVFRERTGVSPGKFRSGDRAMVGEENM